MFSIECTPLFAISIARYHSIFGENKMTVLFLRRCNYLGLALFLALWAGLPSVTLAAGTSNSKNLAPGFSSLPTTEKVVLLPIDVQLYSLSMGGVAEPKADWTDAARQHMASTLAQDSVGLKLKSQLLSETDVDDFSELVSLHAAVASSISLHHWVAGSWALPSKAGQLDWDFGDAMKPLQDKFGARYALFLWVRDSYASSERKAAMVAMAFLGVSLSGGVQIGYASLVDLSSGKVVWFNRLARGHGDLRDAAAATATVKELLSGFPSGQ
jgi:hypothetical protein